MNAWRFQGSKLVLVDWSGVISDDRRIVYEANRRLRAKYGLPEISFEQWLPLSSAGFREGWAPEKLSVDLDTLFIEYREMLVALKGDGIHPTAYADAVQFLREVRKSGKAAIILSSHPQEHLQAEAERYGVSPYVSLFVGSVYGKGEAIRIICAEDRVSPQEAAYLGDTVFDIRAAKESGVVSVGVATGYHTRDRLLAEKPDILVDSFSELAGHLSGKVI